MLAELKTKDKLELFRYATQFMAKIKTNCRSGFGIGLGFGWCVISISGVGNADACNVSRSGLAPIIYDQHLIEIVNNNVRYGTDESIREGNCLGQGSFGTCLITSV